MLVLIRVDCRIDFKLRPIERAQQPMELERSFRFKQDLRELRFIAMLTNMLIDFWLIVPPRHERPDAR